MFGKVKVSKLYDLIVLENSSSLTVLENGSCKVFEAGTKLAETQTPNCERKSN